MSSPDGPEEREAEAQERSEFEHVELDRRERLADESRDELWMRNDGIDAINWPKAITVRPVNTDRLEAQARKMLTRMADES